MKFNFFVKNRFFLHISDSPNHQSTTFWGKNKEVEQNFIKGKTIFFRKILLNFLVFFDLVNSCQKLHARLTRVHRAARKRNRESGDNEWRNETVGSTNSYQDLIWSLQVTLNSQAATICSGNLGFRLIISCFGIPRSETWGFSKFASKDESQRLNVSFVRSCNHRLCDLMLMLFLICFHVSKPAYTFSLFEIKNNRWSGIPFSTVRAVGRAGGLHVATHQLNVRQAYMQRFNLLSNLGDTDSDQIQQFHSLLTQINSSDW